MEYKNKQTNKQKLKKQTRMYKEHFDGCQSEGSRGGKRMGLRRTNW